jgi:hypothetical protein
MKCECADAGGFCAHFGRELSPRQVLICRGEVLTPQKCAIYRAMWRSMPQEMAARAREGPCVHLGEELRREECPTCCGRVLIKVFVCARKGECTIDPIRPINGMACCPCEEWEEKRPA